MDAKKRLHVFFKGNVHGVGFRYTAERVAAGLGLTGWVRNCADGSVEAVCEGAEEVIAAFLEKIGDVFGGYITDRDLEWSDATREFHEFDIRF